MTDTRKLRDLSRQELYDLIWAKTATEVGVEYGITEATVKNHCNNRAVPRPPTKCVVFRAGSIRHDNGAAQPKPIRPVFGAEAQSR